MRAIGSGTVLDANGSAGNDGRTSALASGRLMEAATWKSMISKNRSEIIQFHWFACVFKVWRCRRLPGGPAIGADSISPTRNRYLCDTKL